MTPAVAPTAIDAHVFIDSIQVLGRHRTYLGDLESLTSSIRDLGLLNPITITPDSRLVAGQRRLEACRRLGWVEVPVRIVASLAEASALLRAERDENTERLDMSLTEKMSLAAALEALEKPRALARKGMRTDLGASEPEVHGSAGRVDEIVGPAVGMSVTSYKRAKVVQQAAKDPDSHPDVQQAAEEALADMEATGNIAGNYDKVRKAEARVRLHAEAQQVKAAALAAPVAPDELDPLPARPESKDGELDTSWIPPGRDSGPTAVQQRRKLIAHHAGRGASSRQIAEIVGITDNRVRDIARKYEIPVPADDVMARTRRIDSNRVVRETVYALEGSAMGVQLANLDALDPAECDGWVSSMTDSLRVLNRFVKQLKEKTREA